MDPEQETSSAVCYQATSSGFKKLWTSEGWYGYPDEIFLAPDGISLVRIARFPNTLNGKKIESQSVLFFYFKGKLVKSYKLSNIVRDLASIEDLGGSGGFGSRWIDDVEMTQSDLHDIDTDRKDEKPDEQALRSYNHFAFRLKLLDGSKVFFDLLEGKCISRRNAEAVEADENCAATGNPFDDQNREQGGTDQPAIAPESKPEGDKKPLSKSKERTQ